MPRRVSVPNNYLDSIEFIRRLIERIDMDSRISPDKAKELRDHIFSIIDILIKIRE